MVLLSTLNSQNVLVFVGLNFEMCVSPPLCVSPSPQVTGHWDTVTLGHRTPGNQDTRTWDNRVVIIIFITLKIVCLCASVCNFVCMSLIFFFKIL